MVKRIKAQHHRHDRQWLLGTVSALSLLATAHAKADQVTVKDGDTVWDLANQYQTSVKAIEDANPHVKKISSSVDLIYAGQKLQLSKNDSSQTAQTTSNGTYTVKSGDTLSAISERLHVSIADLVSWNHLSNPDQLTIGQQLIVAGTSTASQTASSVTDASSTPASAAPVASAALVSQAQPSSEVDTAESTAIQADSASVQAAESNQAASASASEQTASSSAADQSSVAVSESDASSAEQSATVAAETASAASNASFVENEATASAQPTASSTVSADESSTDAQSSSVANSVSASDVQSAASATVADSSSNTVAAQSTAAMENTTANSDASSTDLSASASSETPSSSAAQATIAESTTAAADQTNSADAASTSDQSSQSTNSTATVENTSTATTSSSDLTSGSVVSLAVKLANANIPYVWGGASLSGMDCSGLVDYVFQNAEGISLPHYTVSLESCVSQHSVAEAQPGDILFWGEHGSTYHCAIYIGNNQYVAAPQPGQNVEIETISSYFMPSFAGTVIR